MWKYFREAWREAMRRKEADERKSRLIEKRLDYAYLEELVQKVNENPALRVRVTHKDGMVIEIDTTPRRKSGVEFAVPGSGILEVK